MNWSAFWLGVLIGAALFNVFLITHFVRLVLRAHALHNLLFHLCLRAYQTPASPWLREVVRPRPQTVRKG